MSRQRAQPAEATEGPQLRAAYEAIGAYLGSRADALLDELDELLRTQIPAYGAEGPGPLRENIRAILDIALSQLREGRPPGATDFEAITTLARRWASEGRPLDQRAFQLGVRRVAVAVSDHAAELNIDERLLYTIQNAGWQWATTCASILADAQRDHEVAAARRDGVRHASFLRDLATGAITRDRLARESEVLGLDVNKPYFAAEAEPTSVTSMPRLEAHIRHSGATEDRHPLEVVLDGRLYAILPRVPAECDHATIAVGPAAMLKDAHASFAEAAEALATALAFGITGVVSLASLGPLPLVTEAEALARRLTERHLAALDALGPRGLQLEETIRTLLDHDRNIDATAAALHLHRNSVRYRVQRFHEVTGLDLRLTQDVVTTWWLLKRREVERGPVRA